MADYTFDQLVDIPQVMQLLESHHRLSGMAYGLFDADENNLIAVGWQDLCVRFHRVNPITSARCRETNAYLLRPHLHGFEGDCLEHRCGNGMIDVAMPIVISGRHLATFYAGQFFYDDDRPDKAFFRRQAQELGFDMEDYLAALERVPIFSREYVLSNIRFLCNMVNILSEMGLKNLAIAHNITELRKFEQTLRAKQEQLASVVREISMAEERERLRIASVLHDHIGQTLLLGRIKLGALVGIPKPAPVENVIEEVRELLDQAIDDAHSLTVQLNPPMLSVSGLEAALQWLASRMEPDYGLAVEFSDDLRPKPLGDELNSILYQCTRELLINTAKHANTDRAWLSSARQADMYRLTVEDQGSGFNPEDIVPGISKDCRFGLFSIQVRIERLGGRMEIESSPGRGARITIRLPIKV